MIAKPNKPVIFATDLSWSGNGQYVVSSHAFNHDIIISASQNSRAADNECNAEQLFLSGIMASLLNTYLDLSQKTDLENVGFECTATGQAELVDGKMKFTFIHVYPKAFVKKPTDIETALVLLEKAKKVCLLYNSVNAEIIQHAEAAVAKKKNEAA